MAKEIKNEIILIGDVRVKTVPVQECGEPMVDLLIEFPQLTFERKTVRNL